MATMLKKVSASIVEHQPPKRPVHFVPVLGGILLVFRYPATCHLHPVGYSSSIAFGSPFIRTVPIPTLFDTRLISCESRLCAMAHQFRYRVDLDKVAATSPDIADRIRNIRRQVDEIETSTSECAADDVISQSIHATRSLDEALGEYYSSFLNIPDSQTRRELVEELLEVQSYLFGHGKRFDIHCSCRSRRGRS
jgi:hypothetical protein